MRTMHTHTQPEELASDTHHSAVVSVKEIYNFLGITVPQVNIAAVTATDDELTVWTIEVDTLHCKQATTSQLLLNCIQHSAKKQSKLTTLPSETTAQ